jgi:hypothetical protein
MTCHTQRFARSGSHAVTVVRSNFARSSLHAAVTELFARSGSHAAIHKRMRPSSECIIILVKTRTLIQHRCSNARPSLTRVAVIYSDLYTCFALQCIHHSCVPESPRNCACMFLNHSDYYFHDAAWQLGPSPESPQSFLEFWSLLLCRAGREGLSIKLSESWSRSTCK